MQSYRQIVPLVALALLLTGYSFMGAAWTPAPANPPADNADAPLNVGDITQTKTGNLIANVFAAASSTWSPEYCDENGENCWVPSTGTPGGGGGGEDTITIGGRCFEPAWAVGCMWNWSGDGNDTSIYIRPITAAPGSSCPSGRAYQYHSVVLAECMRPVYAWVVGSYSCNVQPPSDCRTAYGNMTRTVVCRDQFGSTVADSFCPAPKPATRGATCSRTSTGSSCR